MPSFNTGNRPIEIEYVSESYEYSRRKVNIQRCYRGEDYEDWYLVGFCHLRREQRTFRSDRIQALWDLREGGELIDDVNNWLEELWQNGPEHQALLELIAVREEKQRIKDEAKEEKRRLRAEAQTAKEINRQARQVERLKAKAERDAKEEQEKVADKIIEKHAMALMILIFVAKADKVFRNAEKRLYGLFLKRVLANESLPAEMEALCSKRASKLDVPSAGHFHYCLEKIGEYRDRPYRMAVCATAKAMLNTDKKVVPYEAELMEHLLRKLKPLEGR